MQIDFAKLFGFNTVSDARPDSLDFKDDTIGARLGAKVGEAEDSGSPAKTIQFSKLLGFENLSEAVQVVDFQNETLGDKLGAKVGPEELAPAKTIDFQDETFGARLGAKVGDLETGT